MYCLQITQLGGWAPSASMSTTRARARGGLGRGGLNTPCNATPRTRPAKSASLSISSRAPPGQH
eukprot:2220302-Lingulodinium_polyedra.AAC.1